MNLVLPEYVITVYDFHFKQCLWRQLKNIGFTVEYEENEQPPHMQNMRCFGIITYQ
jgi:hypothetical protein